MKFEILAYTSSDHCKVPGIKCTKVTRNQKMVEIQKKYIDNGHEKGKSVSSQTIDFYSIMTEVQTKCQKKEIFFFIEDDFHFCDQSALHWILVKNGTL